MNSAVWSVGEDEEADPKNIARFRLALPDKAAQQAIPPEVKKSMGLTRGQLVPVRPHYGKNYATEESAQKSLNDARLDKSIKIQDDCLTSKIFNNKKFCTLDIDINKIISEYSYYIRNIYEPQAPLLRHPSAETIKKVKKDLQEKFNEILRKEHSETVSNGVYIFGIDETLDLHILPAGRDSKLSLEELCHMYLLKVQLELLSTYNSYTHNMLFGQKNLLIAGEMTIENGKIIKASNASGHYYPHGWNLYYGIKAYYETHKEAFAPDFSVTFRGRNMTDWTDWQTMTWKEYEEQKPWKSEVGHVLDPIFDFTSGHLESPDWKKKLNSYPNEADHEEALEKLKLVSPPDVTAPEYETYKKTAQDIKNARVEKQARKYQAKYGARLNQPTYGERKDAFYEILKDTESKYRNALLFGEIKKFLKFKKSKNIKKQNLERKAPQEHIIEFPKISEEKRNEIQQFAQKYPTAEEYIHRNNTVATYARSAYREGNIEKFEAIRSALSGYAVSDFAYGFEGFRYNHDGGWEELYSFLLQKNGWDISVKDYLSTILDKNYVEQYKNEITQTLNDLSATVENHSEYPA